MSHINFNPVISILLILYIIVRKNKLVYSSIQHKIQLRTMIGIIAAFLTALFFALNSVTLRRGVLSGYVYSSTVISILLGIPMYLGVLLFSRETIYLNKIEFFFIIPFIIVGFLHFVLGRYLYYSAVHYAGAVVSMPIMAMGQIIAAYLAIFLLNEKITFLKILGLLIATLGFVIISSLGYEKTNIRKGITLSVLSAFIFASTTLIIRYALCIFNHPVTGVLISYLTALPFYLVVLGRENIREELISIKSRIAVYLIVSAILVNLGQLMRYFSLNLIEVTIASPIISSEIVLNLILSSIVNKKFEIIRIKTIIGSIAIFLGIILIISGIT